MSQDLNNTSPPKDTSGSTDNYLKSVTWFMASELQNRNTKSSNEESVKGTKYQNWLAILHSTDVFRTELQNNL